MTRLNNRLNRTSKTLVNLTVELSTMGDMKIVARGPDHYLRQHRSEVYEKGVGQPE